MSKKIVMVTTEHSIQEHDYVPQSGPPQGEFRNILLYLVATFSPQIILEEWKPDGSSTIGRRIADEKLAGAWHAISPPADLNLSWHGCRNLDGLMLREYGVMPDILLPRDSHDVSQCVSQRFMLVEQCAGGGDWEQAFGIGYWSV